VPAQLMDIGCWFDVQVWSSTDCHDHHFSCAHSPL